MPIASNVTMLIQDTSHAKSETRTVLFRDAKTSTSVYANFKHHYDSDPSLVAVTALFDTTWAILKNSPNTFYTIDQLPILASIGRYWLTLVTKDTNGKITVSNALPEPLDTYLGFDR